MGCSFSHRSQYVPGASLKKKKRVGGIPLTTSLIFLSFTSSNEFKLLTQKVVTDATQ